MPDSLRRIERATVGRDWPRMDYILAVTVGALLVIGMMMVYSATFDLVNQTKGQPAWYLVRQALWLLLGLALLLALARLDYAHLHRISIPLMGVTRAFANGSLQPSELTKLAVVIYIADWLASKGDKIRDVSYGLIPFGVLVGGIGGLIVLEPDLSTAALVVATAVTMFFLAGAEWKQLIAGGGIAALTFGALMMNSANAGSASLCVYRFRRRVRARAGGGPAEAGLSAAAAHG